MSTEPLPWQQIPGGLVRSTPRGLQAVEVLEHDSGGGAVFLRMSLGGSAQSIFAHMPAEDALHLAALLHRIAAPDLGKVAPIRASR